MNVSSVLSESEFKKLGWQKFYGSELEFHELRGEILDESGKPKEKYIGQGGYALFAKDHYDGYEEGFYECFISIE